MNYITPTEAEKFTPLNSEYFHLADSFTRIPCNDGGDEVKYFLCYPENLKHMKYVTNNKKHTADQRSI